MRLGVSVAMWKLVKSSIIDDGTEDIHSHINTSRYDVVEEKKLISQVVVVSCARPCT